MISIAWKYHGNSHLTREKLIMTDWLSILTAAATIAASAKTLVGFAEDIYGWFENLAGRSNSRQAQRVWNDFRQDPAKHKEDLIQVAMDLHPNGDPVLEGYVLGLAKQKVQANRGRIYALLSGPRYTLFQVQDICARMNPALPGLGRDFSQQEAARWAVNVAAAQERLWDRLINSMLEINPDVIPEVVRWV